MIHAIKVRVRIKPGGLIEISHPELPPGEEAEVTVMLDSPVEALAMSSGASPRRPIWEVLEELGATVPDSEWAKVPKDLAKNLDHYLYARRSKRNEIRLRRHLLLDRAPQSSRQPARTSQVTLFLARRSASRHERDGIDGILE